MTRFPTPPNRLPALEPLLNGNLWMTWFEQGRVFPLSQFRASVRYVRLKPSTSCRMTVFGESSADRFGPPDGFLLHLHSGPQRARVAYDKIADRPYISEPSGRSAFLCEEYSVIAVPFPNDIELRALRHVYSRYQLKVALGEILQDYPAERWRISKSRTELRLLAYKPGRRAVYRVGVELHDRLGDDKVRLALHVKVENPTTREQSYRNLEVIHGALPSGADWRVPAPRGEALKRSLVVTEWVDGDSLLAQAGRPREAVTAFRRAGQALAGLHGVRVALDPIPATRAASLVQLAHDLAQLLPQERGSIGSIGRRLARAVERHARSGPCTIHGDFHLGQVLQAGDETVLVDFDRAGLGPAELDVGSFRSHLIELDADPELDQAFLSGYSCRARRPLDKDLSALATAEALFRRAVFSFRRLQLDWPLAMRRTLRRVDHLLAEIGA